VRERAIEHDRGRNGKGGRKSRLSRKVEQVCQSAIEKGRSSVPESESYKEKTEVDSDIERRKNGNLKNQFRKVNGL